MTTTATRRAILAGTAAAIPAAALAAIPAPSAAFADAKLIELGRQFRPLLEAWLPLNAASCEAGWKSHAIAKERTGFCDDRPTSQYQIDRFMDELGKAEQETGRAEFDRQLTPLDAKMDPLAEAIAATPAHTAEGVAAKVLVAIYANSHLWWKSVDELDWDEVTLRSLIEGCCAVAGIPVPTESA